MKWVGEALELLQQCQGMVERGYLCSMCAPGYLSEEKKTTEIYTLYDQMPNQGVGNPQSIFVG